MSNAITTALLQHETSNEELLRHYELAIKALHYDPAGTMKASQEFALDDLQEELLRRLNGSQQ